jgi:transposase
LATSSRWESSFKYLGVGRKGRPIACLGWSSAPRHLGSRDRYIGWSAEARRRNIRFLAYNTRFLILPWVNGRTPGVAYSRPHGGADLGGLAANLRAPDLLSRDVCRFRTIPRNLLPSGQLGGAGQDDGTGQAIQQLRAEPVDQRGSGISLDEAVSRAAHGGRMKTARRRVDVNLDELDRVLDGARQAPLSEDDYEKLKEALHALAAMLVRPRTTEKTSAVLGKSEGSEASTGTHPEADAPPLPGHGRNGAEAFRGSRKIAIAHPELKHGDRCPECGKGNIYGQKEPKVLVRIVGQAPLSATVYSLERLRCGACGQVYTAPEPEGVGPEKYDETAAAMIAQLKYGSGTPFYRLEQLQGQLGIPLPAATQWEVVEEAAELLKPARDELIRQAAQGEVIHNDDTSMRVLRLVREPSDERTGVFTSGIVSNGQGWKIALYFTGRQACRREPCRRVAAACPALGPAHSNV